MGRGCDPGATSAHPPESRDPPHSARIPAGVVSRHLDSQSPDKATRFFFGVRPRILPPSHFEGIYQPLPPLNFDHKSKVPRKGGKGGHWHWGICLQRIDRSAAWRVPFHSAFSVLLAVLLCSHGVWSTSCIWLVAPGGMCRPVPQSPASESSAEVPASTFWVL